MIMSDRGGLAFWRDEAKRWVITRLDRDANGRSPPQIFGEEDGAIWRLALVDDSIVALFASQRCAKDVSCTRFFAFDLEGDHGEGVELSTDFFPAGSWPLGDRWILFFESPTYAGAPRKRDRWVDVRVDSPHKPVVTSTTVDVTGGGNLLFEDRGAHAPWILIVQTSIDAKTELIRIDASHASRLDGYPPKHQPVATGPDDRLISWTPNHETYVIHEIGPEGQVKELERLDGKRAPPAPFITPIFADINTGRGLEMFREDVLGPVGSDFFITRHIAPMPGNVVFARDTFFTLYAERARGKMTIRTQRIDCR
jgi:hypothetical protein